MIGDSDGYGHSGVGGGGGAYGGGGGGYAGSTAYSTDDNVSE